MPIFIGQKCYLKIKLLLKYFLLLKLRVTMNMNMIKKEWKEQADVLFFTERKSITEISKELKVSRQHIAKHLQKCKLYEKEKERRKAENRKKRKEYKKKWYHKKMSIDYAVDSDTLKREHFEAVNVLSYEKF